MKPAIARWTGPRSRIFFRAATAMAPAAIAASPVIRLMVPMPGISGAWVIGSVKTNNQRSTNAMRLIRERLVVVVMNANSFRDRIGVDGLRRADCARRSREEKF
jgi:hypothetical protein